PPRETNARARRHTAFHHLSLDTDPWQLTPTHLHDKYPRHYPLFRLHLRHHRRGRGAAPLAWLRLRIHPQGDPHRRGHDELVPAVSVHVPLAVRFRLRRVHG